MQAQLHQLQARLFPCEADAALITGGINRRYLLGFPSSAGTLLVLPDAAYFIIDSRYFEAASRAVQDCTVLLQEKLYEQMAEIFQKHEVKRVAIEDDCLTLRDYADYAERLPNVTLVQNTPLCRTLAQMRLIKTEEELHCINEAQVLTDRAFSEILNFIRVGVTEKQVAAELEYYMKKSGAEALSFATIAVAGKNSSLPHGVPSDYAIQSGDFLTMDFGAVVNGYHSDMTRTVAVGAVTEEQERVYQTVLEAQLRALDAVKPGLVCRDIDRIARDYIAQSGYGGYFGHGLGHGVGLEIHEEPRFSPLCDVVLEPGMVITVEPGIYLPGKFGVRIEDFVVTTETGAKNFTKSEKKLICLSRNS